MQILPGVGNSDTLWSSLCTCLDRPRSGDATDFWTQELQSCGSRGSGRMDGFGRCNGKRQSEDWRSQESLEGAI